MPSNDFGEATHLGHLFTLLDRGDRAYARYISGGRRFVDAFVLRDNNERLRRLILETAHRYPPDVRHTLERLLDHIDNWAAVWDLTRERTRPNPDDAFVFVSKIRFPSDEIRVLRENSVDEDRN